MRHDVCPPQGGIHPDFTGQTYIDILRAVKDAVPAMHVHAFSPLEVSQGAATLGMDVGPYLQTLKDAGVVVLWHLPTLRHCETLFSVCVQATLDQLRKC